MKGTTDLRITRTGIDGGETVLVTVTSLTDDGDLDDRALRAIREEFQDDDDVRIDVR